MNRDELNEALLRCELEDKRRLLDAYEALRICTLGDVDNLSVSELNVRKGMLEGALACMRHLSKLRGDGQAIADQAVLDLEARVASFGAVVRKAAGG